MLTQMVGSVEVTSRLYTTAPQYVEDQPPFLNIVVRLRTELKPKEVLVAFKTIEKEIGRTPSLRHELHVLIGQYKLIVIGVYEPDGVLDLLTWTYCSTTT